MRSRTRNTQTKKADIYTKHIPYLHIIYGLGIYTFISLIFSFFVGLYSLIGAIIVGFLFLVTWVFGIMTIVYTLTKNTSKSLWYFWFWIIFIIYSFLAFLLWGFNPFTLSFMFIALLLGPFWIFLVVWGFFIDDLHTIVLKIRNYALGNFLVFPFLYSGISKIIGKENTYAWLAFTLLFLLLWSWWFYSRGKVLKNIMRFWLFLNKWRIIERKKWNPLIDNFLSEEKSLKINLTHSNKYINTQKLKRGFIFEQLLLYRYVLYGACMIGVFLGLRFWLFELETHWIQIALASWFFSTLWVVILMLIFSKKIYHSILPQMKISISLSAHADSFYRVNKKKVIFYRK